MSFSFGEIALILLVALLVIKPEQLPEVAQTLGRFAKSIRQFFAKMKEETNDFINTIEKPRESKRE